MTNIAKYLKKACAFTVLMVALPAAAIPASNYASQSALSQGRWVKVRVSETGMQQITAEELRTMGFNDPSRVAVFGYGGALLNSNEFSANIPDDLTQQPTIVTNGKLVFYGQAGRNVTFTTDTKVSIAENYYSDEGYYFLTDSRDALAPEQVPFNSAYTQEVKRGHNIVFQGDDHFNPHRCGAFFFEREFSENGSFEVTFDLPDFDGTVPMSFVYNFGLNGTTGSLGWTLPYDRTSTIPTRTVTFSKGTDKTFFVHASKTYHSTPAKTSDGKYTYKGTISSSALEWAGLDNALVFYTRPNDFRGKAQDRMLFQLLSPDSLVVVANADANTRAWDVTDAARPREYAAQLSGNKLTFTPDRYFVPSSTNHTVVFDPTKQLHSVETVGEVAPQNIHALPTPDMLIIAPKNYLERAEKIAQLHRDAQGLDVLVLDHELIFNEFSSGTPHAHAYRRVAKMFYDRDPQRFRHLLLLGNATFDNRGITFNDAERAALRDNYLLTYECEDYVNAGTHATAYVSDDYFGLLADDFTLGTIEIQPMLINVGRIPCDLENADKVIAKIDKYLKNPPTSDVYNRAVMMSDDGDFNSHLLQSEEAIDMIREAAPDITVVKGHNSIYEWESYSAKLLRQIMSNAFAKGAYYWSYSGHGNSNYWGHENLWARFYVGTTEYAFPPFGMFSTCTAYNYDSTCANIGQDLLYQVDGGVIAMVAAAREVFRDYNQDINTAVAREFYAAKPGATLGDVYRRARNLVLVEHPESENGINNLCYNFGGDPALPLYAPHYRVKIESLGGVSVDSADSFDIYPLAPTSIVGSIVDEQGNVVDTFNGKIDLTLYDPPHDKDVLVRNSGDKVGTVTLDEDILSEESAAVVNGRFSFNFVAPIPTAAVSTNRMSLFAITDDRAYSAVGSQGSLVVNAFDETKALDDTEAPVISEMYLNDAAFVNGQEVDGSFVFYATILPDASGINSSATAIGTNAKLSLDGKGSYATFAQRLANESDGSINIEFPVTNVPDGRHTLTLGVSDNFGNRSSRTISFMVVNRPIDVTLKVAETTARSEANFTIGHNFIGTPTGRFVVENQHGDVVYTADVDSNDVAWDLTADNGHRVPQGLYRAYVILNQGFNYGSSPRAEVVVID